jgi:hypothetical protein
MARVCFSLFTNVLLHFFVCYMSGIEEPDYPTTGDMEIQPGRKKFEI